MRLPSIFELLDLWEKGNGQRAVYIGLAMLSVAYPDVPIEQLARLSIGERDSCILKLREMAFGPWLIGQANCPACGEDLETKFGIKDIQVNREIDRKIMDKFSSNGYELKFRLPNSLDLLSLSEGIDLEKARHILLSRCILSASCQGNEIPLDKLPSEVLDEIIVKIEEIDPQADVQLDLICPECSHRWQIAFDIVSFFWNEIDHWAKHLLLDVHMLARAYGWSEAEILKINPRHRQFYLEMISR